MLNEDFKTVLKGLVDFGEEADRSFADGVQGKDFLNFIDEALGVPKIWKAAPGAWASIKDGMTDEETGEAVDFLKAEFDIANDRAEAIVEGTALWLKQTHTWLRLFKKPAA